VKVFYEKKNSISAMFYFRKCREVLRRETTEGSSIEFPGKSSPLQHVFFISLSGGQYSGRRRNIKTPKARANSAPKRLKVEIVPLTDSLKIYPYF